MKIKIVKPNISNFTIVWDKEQFERPIDEVIYAARLSGVPPEIEGKDVFKMIVENDYGSALEHVTIKYDLQMTKGNASEFLEHRTNKHTGYSTRFQKQGDYFEIILPWHILQIVKKYGTMDEVERFVNEGEVLFPKWVSLAKNTRADYAITRHFLGSVKDSIGHYDIFSKGSDVLMNENKIPRESARYVLPFNLAVGKYHVTTDLRNLIYALGMRLCVRASPEMRCLYSQQYFELIKWIPELRGLVGCRGFRIGVCPEEGVTGVRKGEQHKVYPPCPFNNPDSLIFIPTKSQLRRIEKIGNVGEQELNHFYFNEDNALKSMEGNFKRWVDWEGEGR